MQVGEVAEIQMDDFFDLAQNGGIYEVETPQGWIEIGDLKREKKECFLIRTDDGITLGAGHDHLVETQNGWEKVEDLNIEQTIVNTVYGEAKVIAREFIGDRDTFDFEVLHDKHKYYTNGIVSHNCGKTMTCKWLRNLAMERDYFYRVVTLEEYEHTRQHGSVRQFFVPPNNKPAIVFFDDLDVMVKDRKSGNMEIMPFLTNMDGIYPTDGIVFVFTSNQLEDLDEAFVRPGRIDLWLPFSAPGEKLRTQFVSERFHKHMLSAMKVDDVVKRTDEYTFAEIEEIRKLFAFDIIAGKELSVQRTFDLFNRHREEFQDRLKVGFTKMEDDDEDWDDDDNELWDELRKVVRNPGNVGIPHQEGMGAEGMGAEPVQYAISAAEADAKAEDALR